MPRSSERGAVRRRYLLPGLRARLLRPLASAISGCAGPATARRVTAPNPGRDPAGGHPPPAAAGPLPWPVTGLSPQLGRFPRRPAPPPGLPPQLGRIPRCPAPLPGLPHRRIPAPSRSPGRGPPARPDPGPVPAPGPMPAALPERSLRVAARRRVRSRRSREHCPSGLGFYGVNPQWPGNVLHV
jgi:hypothetical protein